MYIRTSKYNAKRRVYGYYGASNVAALAMVVFSTCHAADALWFDPAFISDDPQMVADLSHFTRPGAQMPGTYQVDVWLNGQRADSWRVRFVALKDSGVPAATVHDNTGLGACLTMAELKEMGVRSALLHTPDGGGSTEECLSPGALIPQAWSSFDFQKMRLDISIPQADMVQTARGWIAPERWNEGINAGLLTYRFSGSSSQGRYSNSSSQYLGLNSGVNLGAWRFRDNSSWTRYDSGPYRYNRWEHQSTYAERTIVPWRSELTLGDMNTSGDVFDALGLRGVMLTTDDSMYPDSMRGYAPVIRGTAATNAQVTVRQNGYVMYQTGVAAGAFVIRDLSPVYGGGDLQVIVTEANDRIRTWTIPYSSIPVLQRPGFVKYAISAGRYRSSGDSYRTPSVAQATMMWGLPHDLTLYGGVQYAERYQALNVGAGLNMGGVGAFSADVTQADSQLADGSRHQGNSLRFLYARSLNSLGTTIQLTGYRYSTKGFHTLEETALKGMEGWRTDIDTVDAEGRPVRHALDDWYSLYNNKHERLEANLSQRLGKAGSLWLTGSHQTYWNIGNSTDSLQAGFSSTLWHVSYSISYSLTRDASLQAMDRALYLSLSVPLDAWSPHDDAMASDHTIYATLSSNQDSTGSASWQGGLSGTALADNTLNWSLSQGHTRGGGDSGDASLDWQAAYGNASLGYSYSSNHRQVSYGVSGGAILHRNGLTLGQPLGDTSILVAAPGAADVELENHTGVRTDWRGYAVVPWASPYQENRVALDAASLDGHTDLDDTVTRVVPTQGAVVRASFVTHTGARALITLTHKGKPLPFGTTVRAKDNSSIVGDAGEVFLSGLTSSGILHAAWGHGQDKQCSVHYILPQDAIKVNVVRLSAICR